MTRRRLIQVVVAIPVALITFFVVWIAVAAIVYSPEYVRRVLVWRETDVGDYLHNFPKRELTAAPQPYLFENAPDEKRVSAAFASALGADDLETFLTNTDTQSFIVIQDGKILYERYFNGWQRDSMVTSFSVAKSFDSTLIGIAVKEGYIGSVDDPITDYLPELAARDPRFQRITIRHLLNMSSGLEFQADRWFLFNGDDPLTSYYPDQRHIALTNTHIKDPAGEYFLYDKYHPQLLGMILERATGMSVTELTQTRLWDPLGMEFDGAWCLDSTDSGFEKMEAGLNARAIDYAKLGQLFLQNGNWNGAQIVSPEWVALASGTNPDGRAPAYAEDSYYAFMWWGIGRADAPPDYTAEGDHGQFIYVSPSHRLVIVRTGNEYGIGSHEWMHAFAQAAEQF